MNKYLVFGFGALLVLGGLAASGPLSNVNVVNVERWSATNAVNVKVASGAITATVGSISVTNTVAVARANSDANVTNSVAVTRANSDANVTNTVNVLVTGGTNELVVSSPLSVVGLQKEYDFPVYVDTTAGGISAGDILAPVVVLSDVAISATNSATLHNVLYYQNNEEDLTNYFQIFVCRAPITWGDTNVAFNPVASELVTNLLCVIDSMDANQGKWMTFTTNKVWTSYGLGQMTKPATNDLYLYFRAVSNSRTNYNSDHCRMKFFLN